MILLVDYQFLTANNFPMNYEVKYTRNMSGKHVSDFSLITSSAQPNTTDPRAPNTSPLNLINMGVDQLSDENFVIFIEIYFSYT